MHADDGRRPVTARRLLRQNVFDRLLAEIVDGTLAPGSRLRDDELTTRLGVSRTPLREALAKLDDLGLVHTAPNRFTRVAPLMSGALFEAVEILVSLTPLLSRKLTEHADDDALLEAEYLVRRISRLPDAETHRALGMMLRFVDSRLHGLELLPWLAASTITRLDRYTSQRPAALLEAGATAPLVAIIEAVIDRDTDGVTRRVVDYLERLDRSIRADWLEHELGSLHE